MKKVLSVLLSVALIISCFSMAAFATVDNAVLKISFKPTVDTIKKGDTVVFEVMFESSADLGLMGAAISFSVGYDSSVFETVEDLSAAVGYADTQTIIYSGYPVANNLQPAVSGVRVFGTERLTAVDTAKGWDKVIFTSQGVTGSCDDDYSTETAAFAIRLKVRDDADDAGCWAIGITDFSIQNEQTVVDEELGSISGPSGTDYGFACDNIFQAIDYTVTIAAAGPVVSFSKAQVKMALNEGKTALAEVADPIQLRVTSTITDADWDTYFGNTVDKGTATTSAISSVGIVAYKGAAADFDEATAKALVTNGTTATGYAAAETTYIQKTADDADAFFGAIIKGSRADAFASDVTFLGFVKYYDADGNTQVAFYETAVTKTITDTTVSDYITAMNA